MIKSPPTAVPLSTPTAVGAFNVGSLLGALPPPARAALGRQVDAERVSVATSVETAEHSLRR